MTPLDAWRRRLQVDAGAYGRRDLYERARTADELALLELDDAIELEAARRPVELPSVGQLDALEDEAAAWVQCCAPELADELGELLRRAPVHVDEDGVIHVNHADDAMQGPEYRDALEELRDAARHAPDDGPDDGTEAGWIGPFAERDDIRRMLEDTDEEVASVEQEVQAREEGATAPAQREAIAEWRAWGDAWAEWYSSDPSTWWGGTITELNAWRAQLARHRQQLELALAGAPLRTPVATPERDPITRAAVQVAETAQRYSGGLAMGVGLALGLGALAYAAATGKLKLGRR